MQDDFQDYCEEDRLTRKLKRGKITLSQYMEKIKELDPDDLQDVNFKRQTILNGNKASKKKGK